MAGEMERGGTGPLPSTGRAHSGQNLAVGESWAPQFEQVSASGAAHSSQNFALEEFSCWHRGHCILTPSRKAQAGNGRTGGVSLVCGPEGVKDGPTVAVAIQR